MGTQNKAVKDIIARIGQIRSEAGLSSRELSLRIGKNESYVHSMEGKYGFEPSLSALLDMIEVCGKTPEEFFYHDPAQYRQDMELLLHFKKLTPEQKAAILTLVEKFLA